MGKRTQQNTPDIKSPFKRRVCWHERNLGKYIYKRMAEENITRHDLDEDTINFFFQQFKVRQ
mgnify:CR=1 FL=1